MVGALHPEAPSVWVEASEGQGEGGPRYESVRTDGAATMDMVC